MSKPFNGMAYLERTLITCAKLIANKRNRERSEQSKVTADHIINEIVEAGIRATYPGLYERVEAIEEGWSKRYEEIEKEMEKPNATLDT